MAWYAPYCYALGVSVTGGFAAVCPMPGGCCEAGSLVAFRLVACEVDAQGHTRWHKIEQNKVIHDGQSYRFGLVAAVEKHGGLCWTPTTS